MIRGAQNTNFLESFAPDVLSIGSHELINQSCNITMMVKIEMRATWSTHFMWNVTNRLHNYYIDLRSVASYGTLTAGSIK